MSRRHADNWSHPGHYLVDPYTWPWSPNGHGHGHEWPTATYEDHKLPSVGTRDLEHAGHDSYLAL